MNRSYKRLRFEDFCRRAIHYGDLIPIARPLWKIEDTRLVKRFLVAYFCFDSPGVASWCADHTGENYWIAAKHVTDEGTICPTGGAWPIGPDRCRRMGPRATRMIEQMRERHGSDPETFIDQLPIRSLATLEIFIMGYPNFGAASVPKIAYALNACLEDFEIVCDPSILLGRKPKSAILKIWRDRYRMSDEAKPRGGAHALVLKFVEHINKELPSLSLPEIRILLCKWLDHMRGQYPKNHELDNVRRQLHAWSGVSATAKKLYDSLPVQEKNG